MSHTELPVIFADTIAVYSSESKYGNACHRFGVVWGCRDHCPVFTEGDCEDVYYENITEWLYEWDEDTFLHILILYAPKLTATEIDDLLNKYLSED